ncbi:MAG: hypothetical protein ACD_48C00659G0003 [uncultured bacterium]|nr:MAG: hypothetical protein ACD_48C00659G0003 [uncultured bacterium]
MYLANDNLATISNNFSVPTRKFYEELKKVTPEFSPNPVIIFDFENDPALKYRIHSSFPATAVALFYGYSNRVPVYNALNDIIAKKDVVSNSLDNLHTFYISAKGVENTTSSTRELLLRKGEAVIVPGNKWKANMPFTNSNTNFTVSTFTTDIEGKVFGAHPSISVPLDNTTVVPNLVTIRMSVTPLLFPSGAETFVDVTGKIVYVIDARDIKGLNISDEYIAEHSLQVWKARDALRKNNNLVNAQLSWKTDQGSIYLTANAVPVSLIADGEVRSYDVRIPAGGTRLEEITLHGFDIPVSLTIHDMKIQPLTREEILTFSSR